MIGLVSGDARKRLRTFDLDRFERIWIQPEQIENRGAICMVSTQCL